jgi:hypothetical protein
MRWLRSGDYAIAWARPARSLVERCWGLRVGTAAGVGEEVAVGPGDEDAVGESASLSDNGDPSKTEKFSLSS